MLCIIDVNGVDHDVLPDMRNNDLLALNEDFQTVVTAAIRVLAIFDIFDLLG